MTSQEKLVRRALADCLQRLQKGESLEQCLARYPQHAAQLRPLLETAAALRATVREEPLTSSREASYHHFLRRAQALRQPQGPSPSRSWAMRGTVVAASLLLAIALGGGATVFAATKSLPDSPLYPVKLGVERARLWITFGDEARAKLSLDRTETRLGEMERIAARGKPIRGLVVAALRQHTDDAASTLEEGTPPPELRARAEAVWAREGQELARLLGQTAPEDRPEVARAFLAVHRGRLQLRGRPPSVVAGIAAPPPGREPILHLQGPLRRPRSGVWAVGEAEVLVGEETILEGEGPQEGRPGLVIAIRLPDGRLMALIVAPPPPPRR